MLRLLTVLRMPLEVKWFALRLVNLSFGKLATVMEYDRWRSAPWMIRLPFLRRIERILHRLIHQLWAHR